MNIAESLPKRTAPMGEPGPGAKRAVAHKPSVWKWLPILSFAGLACLALVALIGVASLSAPARDSVRNFFSQPTATAQSINFAQAQIPRPSATPMASASALPSATLQPAETAPAPLLMEILPAEQFVSQTDYSAPLASPGDQYIFVDISEQHMYVYDHASLVYSFVVSTGIHNATRTGVFHVQSKILNAYGATWNIWMPNWLGIYWAGGLENGIHALPILPNGVQLWQG